MLHGRQAAHVLPACTQGFVTGGRRVPPLNQRKHEKQLAAPTVQQPKPAAGAGAAATGSAATKAKAPVTVAAQPMMAAAHAAAAPKAAAAGALRLYTGPAAMCGASVLDPLHAPNKERDVWLAQQRVQKAQALASLAAAKGKAGADRYIHATECSRALTCPFPLEEISCPVDLKPLLPAVMAGPHPAESIYTLT